MFAPVGTVIRCAECERPVVRLLRRIEKGGVLVASAVERFDGLPSIAGDAIFCSETDHVGFFARVRGERWWIGAARPAVGVDSAHRPADPPPRPADPPATRAVAR